MKTRFIGVLIFCMAVSLTCAGLACAGGFFPSTNHKYQIDIAKTCDADGHPNFVLVDGEKVLNPECTGYNWYGTCQCKRPPSDWEVQNGLYMCYNPKKAEQYGCVYTE